MRNRQRVDIRPTPDLCAVMQMKKGKKCTDNETTNQQNLNTIQKNTRKWRLKMMNQRSVDMVN